MGEGLNFIVTAAQLSNCVGVGQENVYYYRQDNLNSATTVLNVPKYINALAAIDNIENNAIINTSGFNIALRCHRCLSTFNALDAILRTDTIRIYQSQYKYYLSVIRKDALSLIRAHISVFIKIRIWVYCINPKLASKIIALLGLLKRKLF